jgi:large subunit ribosomal protein L22
MPVAVAETELDFLGKRAAAPLKKLMHSAVMNAQHNFNIGKENLFVKDIRVDKGIVMKRHRPVSRGSAHGILKRTSHVIIELAEKPSHKPAPAVKEAKAVKPVKAVKSKPVKKTAKSKK